ncbi:MAG TPA: class I SAM-dependent methyltransferase [Usitatibacter sp.]|nr:class I SAM-dependent methyltransferase [Usitatibacter sp.]
MSSASASPPEIDTTRWYAEKVALHGYDHRGLGFRTRSSQEKRFEALLWLGDFEGRSLLDVGCGFGDFLVYLRDNGIEPRYTGIDICEPMIRRCRERFETGLATFHVGDVLEWAPAEPPDFVVASGIFGLDSRDARARIRPTLRRMFEWARVGMACNFLSQRSLEPAENRVYVDPAEALEMALALTPAVRLDHSYLPNDFTIYLEKMPAWQRGTGGAR